MNLFYQNLSKIFISALIQGSAVSTVKELSGTLGHHSYVQRY